MAANKVIHQTIILLYKDCEMSDSTTTRLPFPLTSIQKYPLFYGPIISLVRQNRALILLDLSYEGEKDGEELFFKEYHSLHNREDNKTAASFNFASMSSLNKNKVIRNWLHHCTFVKVGLGTYRSVSGDYRGTLIDQEFIVNNQNFVPSLRRPVIPAAPNPPSKATNSEASRPATINSPSQLETGKSDPGPSSRTNSIVSETVAAAGEEGLPTIDELSPFLVRLKVEKFQAVNVDLLVPHGSIAAAVEEPALARASGSFSSVRSAKKSLTSDTAGSEDGSLNSVLVVPVMFTRNLMENLASLTGNDPSRPLVPEPVNANVSAPLSFNRIVPSGLPALFKLKEAIGSNPALLDTLMTPFKRFIESFGLRAQKIQLADEVQVLGLKKKGENSSDLSIDTAMASRDEAILKLSSDYQDFWTNWIESLNSANVFTSGPLKDEVIDTLERFVSVRLGALEKLVTREDVVKQTAFENSLCSLELKYSDLVRGLESEKLKELDVLKRLVRKCAKELKHSERLHAAVDKIGCYSNTFQIVMYFLKKRGITANADNLLPLLVYVIHCVKPKNLYRDFQYVLRFRVAERLHGESSYHFTSLFAAVQYLIDEYQNSINNKNNSTRPRSPVRKNSFGEVVMASGNEPAGVVDQIHRIRRQQLRGKLIELLRQRAGTNFSTNDLLSILEDYLIVTRTAVDPLNNEDKP